MDEDLAAMTRDQLIGEARRMRAGIRAHRDSTGHALCWHHPALWALLPEPFPIGREIKMLEGAAGSSSSLYRSFSRGRFSARPCTTGARSSMSRPNTHKK